MAQVSQVGSFEVEQFRGADAFATMRNERVFYGRWGGIPAYAGFFRPRLGWRCRVGLCGLHVCGRRGRSRRLFVLGVWPRRVLGLNHG
jgi:hypothetical protein